MVLNSKPYKFCIFGTIQSAKNDAHIAALEKCTELDDKVKAKQMELQSMGAKYEALLQQHDESVKSLDSLMEERKEMEMEMNALKEENHALKLKCIDVSAYETWQWEEMLQWILMIEEGIFRKYEADLRKSLAQEEPKGEDMQYMNAYIIKRWGVTEKHHIRLLCERINALVSQANDNDNDVNVAAIADKEGNVSGGHYR
eukprot:127631_1